MTTIFTIGHGNRAIGEFVALLREAGIECVVDVRAYPVSRRHPQFAREALEKSCTQAGIRYAWEGNSLGGRRKLAKYSPHVALGNPGLRAYAGHMTTEDFRQALDRLIENSRGRRTAILCAERLPSKCHRCLIADSLVARGAAVEHIIGAGAMQQHALNPLARPQGDNLVYDAGEQRALKV